MKRTLLLILAMAIAASGAVCALTPPDRGAQAATKPITGTWINLPYKDVRNKYTNPKPFDTTDPKVWRAKVDELAKMGMEYLVIMEVANEGKSYYPSALMEPCYDLAQESPVDAILDQATKRGLKVFLSTGWAKDQDDNLRDPAIKKRQLEIMEEVANLYRDRKAFYGWYLPVEDCLCPFIPDYAVDAVNELVDCARRLTPGKKTMISPYGIGLSDFDDPSYEKQMKKLTCDIIAYQDEVGCVREEFTLPRLKENWRRMRKIHDDLNIEMWANCETFTWEDDTNSKESALLPASYPRLLAQQVAASQGGVDRIISFMFPGIIEDEDSRYQLGQPMWSNELWRKYNDWRSGDRFWVLMEAAIAGRLKNNAPAGSLTANPELIDGIVAEENAADSLWQHFPAGYNELVFDFGKPIKLNEVFVRTLNSHHNGVDPAAKTYFYTSDDAQHWSLSAIRDTPYFPNNKYDAWVDGTYADNIAAKARYLKVAFDSNGKVYIDEIFINPTK